MHDTVADLGRLHTNAQRSLRAIRWLGVLGAAVAVGVLALGAMVLLDARRDAWERAEQASTNLVLALERDIARNVATYDLSVQGTIAALRQPGIERATPEVRHMALFDRASGAEYLGSMLVLGPDGSVVATSTSLAPLDLDFADREYFRVHRDRTGVGLFVSRPFRNRLSGGTRSVAFSRRVDEPDGSFGGVVVGSLRLAYFQDLFRKLDLGPGGAVTLLRTDGRVLARHPFREGDLDRDLSGAATFRRFVGAASGSFVGEAALDGVERLYSFRHISDQPLVLSVALSTKDVFSAWQHKASVIGAILALLCGTLAVLCLLFRREVLRRLAAEVSLAGAAEKLAVVASTDALTGLANRRRFDEVLAREWRRAAREQTPLSLLLVDVDQFKRFNDRYGHQGGDGCLRAVASAVGRSVRRPGDLAARYGGEEFAAVLPNTEGAGASQIAERVRAAVEALGERHEGNAGGVVTVSVGWATTYPSFEELADDWALVSHADAALYEAKDAGRNRVAPSHEEGPSPWRQGQLGSYPACLGRLPSGARTG